MRCNSRGYRAAEGITGDGVFGCPTCSHRLAETGGIVRIAHRTDLGFRLAGGGEGHVVGGRPLAEVAAFDRRGHQIGEQVWRARERRHAERAQLGGVVGVVGRRAPVAEGQTWGWRVYNKMGFRVDWEHGVNGPRTFGVDLGGTVDIDGPWRVRYWFGGWDGDLLTGYFQGSLSVPFTPTG